MNATDILNAANAAFGSSSADTGAGLQGDWPPEGEHTCLVTGLSVTTSTFKQGRTNLANVPCAVVQFSYKRIPDPTSPNFVQGDPANEMEFTGREMQIVGNPAGLPDAPGEKKDSYRSAAERDLRRLKGFLCGILRRPESEVTDLASSLSQASQLVDSGKCIGLIKCDYFTPEGKTTTYKTDYFRQLISG